MFDFDTQETPTRSRAGYRRERRRNRRRSAFQLACMTAGLVTAFAGGVAAPAHADLPDFITTSTGLQVYDGSAFIAGGSSYLSTPITTQGNAVFGSNGAAVVIFVQNPQLFIGQSFQGFFNADEGTIVNDIQNQTYSGPDWDNFTSVLESLNLAHIDNSVPINAFVFSNGAVAGTVSGDTISNVWDGGWGIAAEPNAPVVPEPGTTATMTMGALGIVAAYFVRKRRRPTES